MTKESKQTKTKTFVFVVALKRAVLNGCTKSRFKLFLKFLCEEELTVSIMSFWFYKAVDCEVIEYARFQNTVKPLNKGPAFSDHP